MNYLTQHWVFDPMVIGVILTVVAHERGLSRLRLRSAPNRVRRRRRNSFIFYAGLAVLILAVVSPIDFWASHYFFVHMFEHLLISLLAPALIVLGAPWLPLLFALPVRSRRCLGRFFYLSPSARLPRALGRFLRNPWVAVFSFISAMLLWHIPSWYDLAETNSFVHVWLMHSSFLVTGVLFWLQIIVSHPMKPARGPVFQASAVVLSNVVMTVLAISMSFLTTVSWYHIYAHVPGVTLAPFADQQIGAAILWVCGDFWAAPALFVIIRRALESEGSVSGTFDRLMGRGAAPSIESFRGAGSNSVFAPPTDLSDEGHVGPLLP